MHYGLSILAAVYTAIVSGYQILLHIVPGDGGYGMAIFGLHLYTWGFIAAIGFILLFVVLLIFGKSTSAATKHPTKSTKTKYLKWICTILFLGLLLLCLANAVSVFLECGIAQCPGNPVTYKY